MPLASGPSRTCPLCAFHLSERVRSPVQKHARRGFLDAAIRSRPGGQKNTIERERVRVPPLPKSKHGQRHQICNPPGGAPGSQHFGFKRVQIQKDTYSIFEQLLRQQTESMISRLGWDTNKYMLEAWGIGSIEELDKKGEAFKRRLRKLFDVGVDESFVATRNNTLLFRLRQAFVTGEAKGLSIELQNAFLMSVVESRLTPVDNTTQKKLADLRYPIEFYPATRALQRTIHLHVGPTNSGKTYTALKRLEEAESGIYAGPLRLLAHEVYTRFNAKGKKCALVTGEERRIPEGMQHVMSSCTVEMVPLNAKVDVAVIDEIQMMGDLERGWAWTQAFLGVQAKEVHLCGEVRTIELVRSLCEMMGDKLEIHNYERLSPLKPMTKSLGGDLKNLQKGDAVILFSRLSIHAMKSSIESATGRRCAVVYGSLPPETRAQQAALFNDPNNDYDFLAASDAVGMGLNLSIKRIVFEATAKHNGTLYRPIGTSELKQIAGRAGRYKTAHDAIQEGTQVSPTTTPSIIPKKHSSTVGWVTTLEGFDLPIVQKAMQTDAPPLKTAGLLPPSDIVMRFASYFPPETPFSYILLRTHDFASISPHFHLCALQEQLNIADIIQPYNLTTRDRTIFVNAPVALRDHGFADVLREFAECVANQSGGELLDIKSLNIELLDQEIHEHPFSSKGYLRDAELLHKAVTLYLWLSYRFTGVFRSQAMAFHVKSLVEKKIDQCLAEFQWDDEMYKKKAEARQRALREEERKKGFVQRIVGKEAEVAQGLRAEMVQSGVDAETADDAEAWEDVRSIGKSDEIDRMGDARRFVENMSSSTAEAGGHIVKDDGSLAFGEVERHQPTA